ncbi:cell wall cysteine-rich protein [Aspergillus stella-maris]|uniref:cell wall cysteine-rich protein n=1 Tax=Aspergillus stella-maris TaxID=1810926 RepID=UPI003CCDC85F
MVRLSLLALTTSLAVVLALPQNACTTVCRPEKPDCPEGEVAGGSEGCWGCCVPVDPEPHVGFCTAVCRPEKPECPVGEAPTGSEGCWGCCESIPKPSSPPAFTSLSPTSIPTPTYTDTIIPSPTLHICTLECKFEKPECPAGEAPTGSEGCWGCCQPIILTNTTTNVEEKRQNICTTECRPTKPECPAGEAPAGNEDCWGCCQPITTTIPVTEEKRQDVCTTECRPERPECPVGGAPTGQEGCWGCCEPIPNAGTTTEQQRQNICTLECRLEKPECPAGEAPTGSEGCWGCCQPIPTPSLSSTTTPDPSTSPVVDELETPSGDDELCLSVCQVPKPECPEGEAPTGNEECWGCCRPIAGTTRR